MREDDGMEEKPIVSLPLDGPVRERVDGRRGDPRDLLQRDLGRYDALLRWAWKSLEGIFDRDEILLLCDALRNARYDPKRFDRWPSFLAWDLEEVEKYEKLGTHRGIDVEYLSEKVEKMNPLQALCLIDRIEVFWTGMEGGAGEEKALEDAFGKGV